MFFSPGDDAAWKRPTPDAQAIKSGAKLRKVATPPEEKKAPASSSGGGGLLGNEVDKILNLRAKIAADSESSSEGSSDWDD